MLHWITIQQKQKIYICQTTKHETSVVQKKIYTYIYKIQVLLHPHFYCCHVYSLTFKHEPNETSAIEVDHGLLYSRPATAYCMC